MVVDHIDVTRCYKCQRFVHMGKLCSRGAMCGRCAEGHEPEICQEEKGPPRIYAKCKREGNEAEDDVGWWGCPMYRRAVGRYVSRV